VYEDALLYPSADETIGVWESMVISGALAESTTRIRFGQSVVNSPYRHPSIIASMASTLSEVSGGRYVLGIGAGNTHDYDAFGIDADPRYSRFADAIEIIHSLLGGNVTTKSGEFYSVSGAQLGIGGGGKVPINIAAGSPKMLGLVAQFADAWNWWVYGEQPSESIGTLSPILAKLEAACEQHGRDIGSIDRTVDVYSVVAPGAPSPFADEENPIIGSAEEIASALLEFGQIGISEVRCNVEPHTIESIEAMSEVVDLVHRG
jgi:alkanesulfonate monooxygenase SsuD/methylene tetrahydromethanopterin reductase-like flavin-dependent oxidoreductase (luciferase family)